MGKTAVQQQMGFRRWTILLTMAAVSNPWPSICLVS